MSITSRMSVVSVRVNAIWMEPIEPAPNSTAGWRLEQRRHSWLMNMIRPHLGEKIKFNDNEWIVHEVTILPDAPVDEVTERRPGHQVRQVFMEVTVTQPGLSKWRKQ